MSEISRVGVVGSGLMGSGIAEVNARAGMDVVVAEVNDAALTAGKARIEKSLARGVKSGKLSEGDAGAWSLLCGRSKGDRVDSSNAPCMFGMKPTIIAMSARCASP